MKRIPLGTMKRQVLEDALSSYAVKRDPDSPFAKAAYQLLDEIRAAEKLSLALVVE